jgi:hypothetical protein
MIDSLQAIYQRANFNGHPYASAERLKLFEEQYKEAPDQSDLNLQLQYATTLLRAGNTERAIQNFKKILLDYPDLNTINENTKKMHEIYAITLMRKGEIDNCIENHSSESCLLPIQGKGIHVNKTGSSEAIKIYSKLLTAFPDDLQSRWLLNTAYMTLGEYPDKVPPQWLIPPQAYTSDYDIPKFDNIAMHLGLDIDGLAGGTITGDVNNDGYLDIIASSWGLKDQVRLFINEGNGSFKDVTFEAGLKGITGGLNINQTDYNNDGFLDFYIMRGGWNPRTEMGIQPNSLLKNNGDGSFSDVTIEAGLYSIAPSQTSAWFDYNLDGWLDLFVGNETIREIENNENFPCEFFHNNGDGSFTNVANEVRMNFLSYVKGCTAGDINNDGYPDLYVSNMNEENYLFLNNGGKENGTFQFQNIADQAGVKEPVYSFPCWFFDFDNDGWEDIFVASFDNLAFINQAGEVAADYLNQDFQSEYPRLYKNNGDMTYTDITKSSDMDRAVHTMGCNYGDIDNDGFIDFYLGTGAPDYRSIVPNRMFRNDKGTKVQDVTSAGGFGHIQKGHGISFGDLDNDGDSDIYAIMGGSFSGDNFQNALFENPGNENGFVIIDLEGSSSNKSAFGSRVKLNLAMKDGSKRQLFRTVSNGASFGSNSRQLEIGLGTAASLESIEVNWASKENSYISYGSAEINQKLKIVEGQEGYQTVELKKIVFDKSGSHQHNH